MQQAVHRAFADLLARGLKLARQQAALLQVQRNGPIGSPRVAGSTSFSSATTKPAS